MNISNTSSLNISPSSNNDSIVSIKALTKTFGSDLKTSFESLLHGRGITSFISAVTILSDINLELKRGEVLGLLGENGAGKTTLIRILSGILTPSSGSASVCGYDIREAEQIKKVSGFASGDERSFFLRLTGFENLLFFGRLHGISETNLCMRIGELADFLGFAGYLDKPMNKLSAGMKQSFSLARALLHDPDVIFLDEPGKSLDPGAKERLRIQLRCLSNDHGKTLFIVTHDYQTASEVCDRFAVLQQGQLIKNVKTKDIVKEGEWWNELFSL